jgi:proline iminopeptidase
MVGAVCKKRVLWLLVAAVMAVTGTGAAAQARELHVRSTDGVRLAAWATGSLHARAAVIMIAGGPGESHQEFGPMPAALSRFGLLAVTYDARGVSASTPPSDGRYTLSAYVEDLEALRHALGVQRIALVGHSFGGLVAAAYAVAHPGDLFALSLVDAEPADRNTQLAGLVRLTNRIGQLQNEGVIPNPLPSDQGISCTAHFNATTPAYLGNPRERVPSWMRSTTCSTRAFNGTFPYTVNASVLAPIARGLGRLVLPALDVFGSKDVFGRTWDLESARLLKRAHPRVVEIKGGGHYPYLERPAETFAALGTFFGGAETRRCGAGGVLCMAHLR